MDLIKRTKDLHQRVGGLAAARGLYDEVKGLEDFRADKLAPRLKRLTGVRATCDAFAQRSIPEPAALVPETLPAKVARLRDRFIQSPTRTTLVAPNGWPSLQSAVDGGLAGAESALQNAWSAYCSAKAPRDEVAVLRQDPDIAGHPENGPLLQQYEKLYQQLAKASSILPRTPQQIDEMLTSAGQAQSLLDRLNREPPSQASPPPPDAQRFLQALQRQGAASLELMTPEVLQWLASNGRLGQFEVRRKAA